MRLYKYTINYPHANTDMYAHTHTHTVIVSESYTCIHTYTCKRMCAHNARTCTHTHIHAHAHTHTHTHFTENLYDVSYG